MTQSCLQKIETIPSVHLLLHNTGVKTFHRFSLQTGLPQLWIFIWDSFSCRA